MQQWNMKKIIHVFPFWWSVIRKRHSSEPKAVPWKFGTTHSNRQRLFTIRCLWLVLSVQGHCKSHLWPEEAKKPENTAIAQCRHRYSARFMIQCHNDKALVKHRSILASSHWKRSFQHYFLWSTPQWSSDPFTSSWSFPPNHSSMVD